MRITRVSTTIVNAEMRNWIFVRVDTDMDGLFGWGEATVEWKARAVAGAIEDLQRLVLGRDPRDIKQLVRGMKKHSFWRLGIIGMSAVSGIEIAPWDILGEFLNQPVWRLLGGKVRDRVKVYTHLGLGDMRAVYESNQVDPVVERALEVVGDDIEIMVDFHGRPASIGAALAYVQALEPGRPMFVEEVLPPGDAPAM